MSLAIGAIFCCRGRTYRLWPAKDAAEAGQDAAEDARHRDVRLVAVRPSVDAVTVDRCARRFLLFLANKKNRLITTMSHLWHLETISLIIMS